VAHSDIQLFQIVLESYQKRFVRIRNDSMNFIAEHRRRKRLVARSAQFAQSKKDQSIETILSFFRRRRQSRLNECRFDLLLNLRIVIAGDTPFKSNDKFKEAFLRGYRGLEPRPDFFLHVARLRGRLENLADIVEGYL
jgi:hypothetical protein